jgi:2,3-bisphosphoglycerate-independent phosphoglycerate mutase
MSHLEDSIRKRQLSVVYASGFRQRFLRGMVTHDLVQRGLDFDSAYAVANTIRDRLANRDEVETVELRDLIQQELEKLYGPELSPALRDPARPAPTIRVNYRDQEQPFSRGLLARSIEAAGVDLDRAYGIVTELEAQLRSERTASLPSSEIVRRVGELIERLEGTDAARRYRMVRRLHHLSKPLILYIGGATGTGKSTLALELAPLLRIQRVNATDTIRQVMRMVFTRSILPALHSSSFEAADPREPGTQDEVPGSLHDPEYAQLLIDTFEEQATRVCVGVRAVVDRALAENTSVLIEGVHLHPAIVPFPDLDGLAYQVPLFLSTLNEETHRARFLARARTTGRRAERYLENFDAIRFLHDHLLQQIEAHERPLLDTSASEPNAGQTLRVVTGILERQAPFLASDDLEEPSASAPTLLVVIDGLADRPTADLGGRTPLQAARTPTFDRLAREGRSGLAEVAGPGGIADTAAGTLALLGQSPLSLHRGPAEAIGAGFELTGDDIALRGNLATVDDAGIILDRRAGRIREGTEELVSAIDGMTLPGEFADVTVRVKPGSEHRVAVMVRGNGLSPDIRGSDPGEGVAGPPLTPRPLDRADDSAVYTAKALALFEQGARAVLAAHPLNRARMAADLPPANAILTRGPGRIHRLLPLEEGGVPLRITCIGGDQTVLGLARMLGASTISSPEMTANLDSNVDAKFTAAEDALHHNNLVLIHLKGADIAAHDRRPDLKVQYLERVDGSLGRLLDAYNGPLRVVIASDHATLSENGQHASDPVPVVIWGEGVESDTVETYDEESATRGALQTFPMQRLLTLLFRLS